MKEYTVKVIEKHIGYATVEAESWEEAQKKAYHAEISTEFESVIDMIAVETDEANRE